MLAENTAASGSGKFVADIKPDSSIKSVVTLIENNLDEFSSKVTGHLLESEKALTSKLCIFLNNKVDSHPFRFHHEFPEDYTSGTSAQVDIGTITRFDQLTVEDRIYGEFDSFFSIEAKRLPTPGNKREKEYVIGHDKSCGGIERFKKGIHGSRLKQAAIVGYIQKHDTVYWHSQINNWIDELIIADSKLWKLADKLVFRKSINHSRTVKLVSKNHRLIKNKSDIIKLTHFWINIT